MSRPVKRLLISVGLCLLVVCMYVGWLLLAIEAAAHLVVWQSEHGGLTLTYFPLKDQAIICAGDEYVAGGERTWTMTEPGGTDWIIAAPVVPSPEELLGRAWIRDLDTSGVANPSPHPRYGLRSSSAKGLVSFYAAASGVQRLNIVDALEEACKESQAFCEAFEQVRFFAARDGTFECIDDPDRFKSEGEATVTPGESKAIAMARGHLERQYGKEIRATFAVASAEWGYQVDFTDVQCIGAATGQWEPVAEGFGRVFLSWGHDVVRIEAGP